MVVMDDSAQRLLEFDGETHYDVKISMYTKEPTVVFVPYVIYVQMQYDDRKKVEAGMQSEYTPDEMINMDIMTILVESEKEKQELIKLIVKYKKEEHRFVTLLKL